MIGTRIYADFQDTIKTKVFCGVYQRKSGSLKENFMIS
ncbi:MAG: hypothetical protein H6Q42_3254 [Deltaproteobacteria bacterium]|nr:hypothetical protein [Deltaproteobacteria bacterium]